MSPKTFMKDLRRFSRTSFHKGSPKKAQSNSSLNDKSQSTNGNSNGNSSATLDNCSSSSSHTTPPPSLPTLSSCHLPLSKLETSNSLGPLPQRTVPISSHSSRSSGATSSHGITSPSSRTSVIISPFAPRVTSISENSWVNHKVVVIYGQVGEARGSVVDGIVTLNHLNESFTSTTWPVRDSHFKALVHLVPGPNRIRLDFVGPKVPNATVHQSVLSVNYLPMINCPPLNLVVLLGKDSDGHFDTPPEKASKGENSLDIAIRKFRMAAYLWQAFTQEQMYRHNFARRSFRFEEEWQTGTLSSRDSATLQMRNEAKVHVVRCDKTVAELKDLASRQAVDPVTGNSALFELAKEAIGQYFSPKSEQKAYVSALILDTHWENQGQSVVSHGITTSPGDNIELAIFGSQGLHSYPSCIEEVVPAFTDCTRTDINPLANGNSESGSTWEAASSNIGAHLREVGRLFGCSKREKGIMGSDYLQFNRSFTTWEPYCTRTKTQGLRLCLAPDETSWHRLDALRFRLHPCFRHPSDPPPSSNGVLYVWPVEGNKLVVTSTAGIAFIEIYAEDGDVCKAYIDYMSAELGNNNNGLSKQVKISEDEIRARLPENCKKSKRLKLRVYSGSLQTCTIEDLALFRKNASVKLPNGQTGYRSNILGSVVPPKSVPQELFFDFAFIQTKLLTSIKVYHGPDSINGIGFCYEDATIQFFGNQDSEFVTTSEYVLNTRKGELLTGFYVRAEKTVQGLGIITNMGKIKGVCGNATAGVGHTLIAPRGYKIAGVSGSFGGSIDSLSLVITR